MPEPRLSVLVVARDEERNLEDCLASARFADERVVVVDAASRDGTLEITGRSWREDGKLSARYWSEAAKEKKDPSGIFYFFRGERPLDSGAPKIEGTGEIVLESTDRAGGYFVTRSDGPAKVNTRTVGVYLRADAQDLEILDGSDNRQRVKLIASRLKHWKSIKSA